jgi:hypothetical protein
MLTTAEQAENKLNLVTSVEDGQLSPLITAGVPGVCPVSGQRVHHLVTRLAVLPLA